MPAKKTTKAATEETKVEEVKAEETAETKPAAKKSGGRKTKAKEPKVNVIIEYLDKNTVIDDIVDAVKEAYKADGNEDAIETIDVYFQPEKNVAYYVVNGKAEDKFVEF